LPYNGEMETSAYEDRKDEVINDLERIHGAIARAPADEKLAKRKGIRAGIRTAVASIVALMGGKAFSDLGKYYDWDFVRAAAEFKGPIWKGAAGINFDILFARVEEGFAHAIHAVTAPGLPGRVLNYFGETLNKSAKKFAVVTGGIAALSSGVGVYRYIRERNKARDQRFHEIGTSVQSIAENIGENPQMLEDKHISGAVKEHITNLPRRSPGGWIEAVDEAQRELEARGIMGQQK